MSGCSHEVVDLTVETPPPKRMLRKRRATPLIDLTAQSAQTSPAESSEMSIEIIYENRRTPVPPTRVGRRSRNLTTINIATDDSDNELPFVMIPSKQPTLPVAPPLPPSPQSEMPKCSVCLETVPQLQANNIDLIITNGCAHFFCKRCIVESLNSSKHCPRCRRVLKGKTPYKAFYF